MNKKESINKTRKGVQRYFLLQCGGNVRTGRPLPTHPTWGSLSSHPYGSFFGTTQSKWQKPPTLCCPRC